MITFKQRGNFRKTNRFLERAKESIHIGQLDKYGRKGVAALKASTPKDSGDTANSWYYEIVNRKNGVSINWCNRNVNDGIPIVILIQYGHGTRGGAYVEGNDFINPTIQPLFNEIAEDIWKEVTK